MEVRPIGALNGGRKNTARKTRGGGARSPVRRKGEALGKSERRRSKRSKLVLLACTKGSRTSAKVLRRQSGLRRNGLGRLDNPCDRASVVQKWEDWPFSSFGLAWSGGACGACSDVVSGEHALDGKKCKMSIDCELVSLGQQGSEAPFGERCGVMAGSCCRRALSNCSHREERRTKCERLVEVLGRKHPANF